MQYATGKARCVHLHNFLNNNDNDNDNDNNNNNDSLKSSSTKRDGCSSAILKRTPKRNLDPVFWAWYEIVFSPKRYQIMGFNQTKP